MRIMRVRTAVMLVRLSCRGWFRWSGSSLFIVPVGSTSGACRVLGKESHAVTAIDATQNNAPTASTEVGHKGTIPKGLVWVPGFRAFLTPQLRRFWHADLPDGLARTSDAPGWATP